MATHLPPHAKVDGNSTPAPVPPGNEQMLTARTIPTTPAAASASGAPPGPRAQLPVDSAGHGSTTATTQSATRSHTCSCPTPRPPTWRHRPWPFSRQVMWATSARTPASPPTWPEDAQPVPPAQTDPAAMAPRGCDCGSAGVGAADASAAFITALGGPAGIPQSQRACRPTDHHLTLRAKDHGARAPAPPPNPPPAMSTPSIAAPFDRTIRDTVPAFTATASDVVDLPARPARRFAAPEPRATCGGPGHSVDPASTARRFACRDASRFLATILFTDLVDSTLTAARLGDGDWRELLVAHRADCHAVVAHSGGRVVDTTGDGMVAVFDAPTRAVRAGMAIQAAARRRGLAVRTGVHTGECERLGDDIAGIAVHIAARVCALAAADEVMTTSTVRDLVTGSMLSFDRRGARKLKGVPGRWTVFSARECHDGRPRVRRVEHVLQFVRRRADYARDGR